MLGTVLFLTNVTQMEVNNVKTEVYFQPWINAR